MTALEQSIQQKTEFWGQEVLNEVTGVRTTLEDVFNGRTQICLFAKPITTPPIQTCTRPPKQAREAAPSTSAQVSTTTSALLPGPAPQLSVSPPSRTAPPRTVPVETNAPVPSYELSRAVNSVPDLWREWTQGLSGQPSIQSLEDQYGVSWRKSQKEKTFFS